MIKIIYANINGYKSKKLQLFNYIENNNVDGCMLVETKTKSEDTAAYRNWQYICKHGHTTNNARGGALTLFSPKIRLGKANPPSLNNPLNDCIHFTIPFMNEKIHILLTYIHPHSDLENNILTKAAQYKYVIIIGDINANKRKNKQLNTFLDTTDFIIRHTPPTFLMTNNKDTTPDVLIHTSNLTPYINDIDVTNELGSDHLAITFTINLQINLPTTNAPIKLNLNKTDIPKIVAHMENYTQTVQTDPKIEDIQNELTKAIRKHSPPEKRSFFLHRLPKYILTLIKQKREMYRLYTRTLDKEIKTKLNKLNKDIHIMIQQYRLDKWLKACQDIERDRGKSYWTKIKRLSNYGKNKPIGNLSNDSNETLTTDQDKANAFARHYCKTFQTSINPKFDEDNWTTVTTWYNNYFTNLHTNENELRHPKINDEEYDKALSQLKNTAPGKDNIQAKILKNLPPDIHQIIRDRLDACIKHNTIPTVWKQGIIIPIHKNGTDDTQIKNYRPITLLSVFSKLLEQIIKNRLAKLTKKHIPHYQFGFKPKHSTIHPLFILTNNIQTTHLQNGNTATLLMDINKAFDTVWHAGLLYKLFMLGIPKYLIFTIKNLLSDRQLEIRINDTHSTPFTPKQGLPQGSPLSPLLYNIYCHDMYNHNIRVKNHVDKTNYILQYADDTALIAHGKNTKQATERLQLLTDRTMTWLYKWRLTPNPQKNQLLLSNHKITPNSPTIMTDNITTKPTNDIKYLGITIDNKLKFTKHVKQIRQETTKRAKHFRSLTYKNMGISTKTSTQIYKTICRPVLDYGNIILTNATDRTKIHLQTTEQITLRLITKIRHPNNPLYNPPTHILYEQTELIKFTDRTIKLQKKFTQVSHNMTIIEPLCLTRQDKQSRFH